MNNLTKKIKTSLANESSVASYCLLMCIYCFNNIGASQISWVYLSLTVLFAGMYWYRIYSSNAENKTYTFFQFDSFAIGLFLITIYFDVKWKFINFNLDSLSKYFLVLGLLLVITHIFKYIFRSKMK